MIALEQDSKPQPKHPEAEPRRERNDRIVAVPVAAARVEWRSTDELPQRYRQEIEQFFLNTTFFEHKNARILGWEGPDEALALVQRTSRR